MYHNAQEFTQEVLEAFTEEDGSVLEEETGFNLYLYTQNKADAKSCAKQLTAHGYQCDVEESYEDEDSPWQWLCFIQKTITPNEAELTKMGELLLTTAQSVNGKFDNWDLDFASLGIDMEELAENFFETLMSVDDEGDLAGLESLLADPDPREIAQMVLDTLRTNFSYPHELVEVDEQAINSPHFEHLDLQFYQAIAERLAMQGFVHIADIEDKTISNQTEVNVPIITFARAMWHAEDKILANFFYVEAIDDGFVDMISVTESQQVIHTTTVPSTNEVCEYDKIDSVYCDDEEMTLMKLLGLHENRLEDYAEQYPNDGFVALDSADKVINITNYGYKLKSETLEKIGWVTKDYLLQQTGGNDEFAEEIYQAVQQILAEELADNKGRQ